METNTQELELCYPPQSQNLEKNPNLGHLLAMIIKQGRIRLIGKKK